MPCVAGSLVCGGGECGAVWAPVSVPRPCRGCVRRHRDTTARVAPASSHPSDRARVEKRGSLVSCGGVSPRGPSPGRRGAGGRGPGAGPPGRPPAFPRAAPRPPRRPSAAGPWRLTSRAKPSPFKPGTRAPIVLIFDIRASSMIHHHTPKRAPTTRDTGGLHVLRMTR